MVSSLFCLALASSQGAAKEPTFTTAQLLQDLSIAKKALEELHPGLTFHASPEAIESSFAQSKAYFQLPRKLTEVHREFMRLTASVRCGHTYCNPFNQSEANKAIFEKQQVLPFAFEWMGSRMAVTRDGGDGKLPRGTEILEIGGKPVAQIQELMMESARADGANDAKRASLLSVYGAESVEPFDQLLPAVVRLDSGRVKIKARFGEVVRQDLTVNLVSAKERSKNLKPKVSTDLTWKFKFLDSDTALMTLPTFVIWQSKQDWKGFLKESFEELNSRPGSKLIIDVRGNEGGADEVNLVLGQWLASEKISLPVTRSHVKYQRVSPELRPFLATWDEGFYNFSKEIEKEDNGLFLLRQNLFNPRSVGPIDTAFKGPVVLLVDSSCSSATYYLARIMQSSGRAKIVGRETGGSQKGMTGGRMMFLTLPNTKIEIDIPLVLTRPTSPLPDQGVMPDVLVQREPADLKSGKDRDIEAAMKAVSQ
jgi:C-terminal processing protease CtpA/Prc